MLFTHQVNAKNLRSVFFLLLHPVGKCCKAHSSFKFPVAKAFKVETGISARDRQQIHEQHRRICSSFLFSALAPSCRFVRDLFVRFPVECAIFRGDLQIWMTATLLHTHTRYTHNNPSPTLSVHPANRPCTAMHDKGMQQFDKDEPQQSRNPLSRHELTNVINQQRLFTGCGAV